MPRGAKPYFTPEQDQQVAARYLAGESMYAIAATYGVSYIPVRAALTRCGIHARSKSDYAWQATAENTTEVVRLFREGLGVQKIARRVGTGNNVISRVLREAGVKARYGGQNHRFKGEQREALIAAYGAGESAASLARKHQCSVTVVRNTLRRAGVEVRPKGPAFWTPERIAWLREQYALGSSQGDLARELGYSQSAISTKLRDLGVLEPSGHPSGSDHPSWQGGRIVNAQGYVMVKVTEQDRELVPQTIHGGYAQEHRLVMARALGRPLQRSETVHHVNGNRADNRLVNLQLRQGNHGQGVTLRCKACGSHDVEAVPLT